MLETAAWKRCAVAALAFALAIPHTASSASEQDTLQQQRAAFRSVYPDAERGRWDPVEQQEDLLRDYALWPDLEAANLRATLRNADHATISTFLERHGTLKPARDLRYQFALHLAGEAHWPEFLALYEKHYRDLGVAKLDCLALNAAIETGNAGQVVDRGLKLWRFGQSQADECDPVFTYLRANGALTDEQYAARFSLAIDSRRFTLARYLAASLDGRYLEQANRWLEAQRNSERFLANHANRSDSSVGREQLIYALERIAFDQPLLANEHWAVLRDQYPFTAEQRQSIERHMALWAARQHLPEADTLLRSLPADAYNTEVRRWTTRVALRREAWDDVLRAIASLSEHEQQVEEWRYWEAIALQNAGQPAPATLLLEDMAAERSYYGFLAADATGKDYAFADSRLLFDETIAAQLELQPELIRARELFYVGIEGRGRSEWDAAVAELPPEEKIQAALLAHRWGWHSRAIATASGLGEYDDLNLRYPLPWREDFARYAADANLDDSFAYGVARSESLFMRDIRSSAGAIGVMQLLPETGRRMARAIGYPYSGLATLTDQSSNVRLGTLYLQKMLERFDDHPALATAAYNAGPGRVEAWLPEANRLDARIWIENIPYNETRSYVRRVLTADAIFNWRLTGVTKRISSALGDIKPGIEDVAAISSSE